MIKFKNLLSKFFVALFASAMVVIVAAVLLISSLQYTPVEAYTMISAKFEQKTIQMAEAR